MAGWPRSATHPTVFPVSFSTLTAPATPAAAPAEPTSYTSLPSLTRSALGESWARPLVSARPLRNLTPLSGPLELRAAPCTTHQGTHHPPLLHRTRSCAPLLLSSRIRHWPSCSLRRALPATPRRFPPFLPIPTLPLRRSASSCPLGIRLRIALRSALLTAPPTARSITLPRGTGKICFF